MARDKNALHKAGDLAEGFAPSSFAIGAVRLPGDRPGVALRFDLGDGQFGPHYAFTADLADRLGRQLIAAAGRAKANRPERN